MRAAKGDFELALGKMIERWHPALRRSFREYSSSTSKSSRRMRMKHASSLPYWLVIPRCLGALFLKRQRADQQFLVDVLTGQFYVFVAVKIHDDLFDGHIHDRSLLFAADHFLLSARGTFAPYFSSHSTFWTFFDSSIGQTLDAIIALDQSQLRGYGSRSSVAALMKREYAAVNIATYAICLRSGKLQSFRAIAEYMGELAFVGQSLDDLEDIMSDYKRGRMNYAAQFLMGSANDGTKDFPGRVMRKIVLDGSTDGFFKMLYAHLQRASSIAGTTALPMLVGYVASYRNELQCVERQLHRMRVRLLFGR